VERAARYKEQMLRRHIWWLAPLAGAAVAGGVVAAVSLGGGSSSKNRPQTSHARLQPAAAALAFQDAITAVVHELSPSVVQIQSPSGLGSGIVFDSNGDIVTNNHVVGGTDRGPFTVTAGRHSYGASLVGRFPPDDLAVVRVSGAHLSPAAFADSHTLSVGDFAIAIGNPLGLRSSVTDGIVSAFRQGVSEGNGVALPLMIQTSAPINPGNSGGALADLQGRVIGIPTLAATDPELGGGTAPGIGFAIPSNLVKDIATQIIRFGHVVNSHRAYLGVVIAETNGAGVLVQRVTPGGPAAKAGLKAGDVIVKLNGQGTPTVDDLTSVASELKPGTKVTLGIVTKSGKHETVHLTLGTFPGRG
jgi:putative serine protease PepD